MSSRFEIESVTGEDWLRQIGQLRMEVWRHNNMIDLSYFDSDCYLEEVDESATHLVVRDEGKLVAATRVTCYPDLQSTHHGSYYTDAGIELEGPIVIPERTVVHPQLKGQGLHRLLSDAIVRQALEWGARYTISECTPAAADLLRKRGRRSFGQAPADPLFPSIRFEWMSSDVQQLAKELLSG